MLKEIDVLVTQYIQDEEDKIRGTLRFGTGGVFPPWTKAKEGLWEKRRVEIRKELLEVIGNL